MTTLRRTLRQTRALVPAAMCAWGLTVLAGWAGAVALSVLSGSSSIAELATIYVPIMIAPFGLAMTVVMLPFVAFASALVRIRRAWVVPLVGLASAPLAMVGLVAAGRMVFGGSPRMRPTLTADLAAVVNQPDTVPILIALGLGGTLLGWWAARMFRPGSPANLGMGADAR